MYELVAILDGERLTIYLDRYEDNSPVPNAVISVLIDAETVPAESAPDGTYIASSKLFRGSGALELVFDIKRPGATISFLVDCHCRVHHRRKEFQPPAAGSCSPWSRYDMPLQDHLVLVSGALLIGLIVGLAI